MALCGMLNNKIVIKIYNELRPNYVLLKYFLWFSNKIITLYYKFSASFPFQQPTPSTIQVCGEVDKYTLYTNTTENDQTFLWDLNLTIFMLLPVVWGRSGADCDARLRSQWVILWWQWSKSAPTGRHADKPRLLDKTCSTL